MNERHNQLLAYVTQRGKTSVDTLADHLQTSKVTIRKDLSELSKRGIIKRERGYALPNDPGDIYYRMAFHFEQKQKIARTAAAYVHDGETLIIESGSTCALFAEELAKTKKNITIITNSMYLADYIKEYTDVQLIILGGTLQQGSQSLVGPLTKSAVGAFHVDKIFIGTDGYSHDFGFTGDDLLRSDTLAAMTAASEHIYVVADSGKFTRPGQVSFLKLQDVHEVITDQEIPAAEIDFLKKQGIKVTIA